MYNGKRFRISPDGFIQVNKQAAELVYRLAVEHAQLDENTILLDIGSTLGKREDPPKTESLEVVCVRLGVYSVMASPLVKKVYAIDPLASCIEDGKFNAKLNDCRDNIEWICSFAEANLHRILKKIGDLHAGNTRIVAIINPSRYGLSKCEKGGRLSQTLLCSSSEQNHSYPSRTLEFETDSLRPVEGRRTSDAQFLRVSLSSTGNLPSHARESRSDWLLVNDRC